MAVPKEKTKARIKALYPKTNLTQQRMDAIAAKLSEKLADDADDDAIDAVINDFNDIMPIEEIAKNDDRIRTLTRKAADVTEKKPNAKNPEKEEKAESNDDDPMSILLNEMKSIKTELAAFKAKDEQKSLEERFRSDERLKDVPAALLKGRIPKDETSFDEAIDEIVSDWAELSGSVTQTREKSKLSAFGKDTPPAGSGGGEAKQVSDKEADEVAKKLVR